MQLSKKNTEHIHSGNVSKPLPELFALPEKVLQFGTGVLLRGLPDYFIDKANRVGVFNGRIVVVKSTAGSADAFNEQDGLYTLCIRGIEGGNRIEENVICSAVSRVLSAAGQWAEVLACAHNPDISIIISNTTEVGIQFVEESVFQSPPQSFPARLLAFLHERFKKFGADETKKLVLLPTELIGDNGTKLKAVVTELIRFNKLENAFSGWLDKTVFFCNTLVDCIVPGKPEEAHQKQLEEELGYEDKLLAVSEAYRLWAIEGGGEIRQILSFAQADARVIVAPDITKYKELKLRLLNGTHTLSCGLAHLAGIRTVNEAMNNAAFDRFITSLMLDEIAPAIPAALSEGEAPAFGRQVLDRFRNPHIRHQWLNITLQYSSKMAMRVVPVLLRYVDVYKTVPQHLALGFAAYLLFMKSVKKEADMFFGECNGELYRINDAQAGYYFNLWETNDSETVVKNALRNKDLWNADLSKLNGFETAVCQKIAELITHGALQTIVQLNDLAVPQPR